jgi:uncharacterized protein YjiS (DUF1127 family)
MSQPGALFKHPDVTLRPHHQTRWMEDMMTRLTLAPFTTLATRALAATLRFGERARMRRALRRLDDHLLRDVGLSRDEAEALADSLGVPADWDVPPHWRIGHSRPKACANPACDA